MNTEELIDVVNITVEKHINKNFEMTQADRAGLDFRCGGIMISEDAIAVEKYRDGTLQYYGGFEYVDKQFRREIGDYVFYLYDDSRVASHIDQFFDRDDEEAA